MKMSKVCLIDRRDPKIHYDSKDIRSVLTPQLIELVRSSENGVDERAIRLQLIYMPRRTAFIMPSTLLSGAYIACLIQVLISLLCDQKISIFPASIMGLLAMGAAFLTRDLQHDIASLVCVRSRLTFGIISLFVFLSGVLATFSSSMSLVKLFSVVVTGGALLSASLYCVCNTISLLIMWQADRRGCQLA